MFSGTPECFPDIISLCGCFYSDLMCFCRKRVLAVLQDMLALPQTPSSLVSLLTEKLLTLIPDDHRRIQTVSHILHLNLFSVETELLKAGTQQANNLRSGTLETVDKARSPSLFWCSLHRRHFRTCHNHSHWLFSLVN